MTHGDPAWDNKNNRNIQLGLAEKKKKNQLNLLTPLFWTKFARFKERGKDTSSRYRDPEACLKAPASDIYKLILTSPLIRLGAAIRVLVLSSLHFCPCLSKSLSSLVEWKPHEGKAELSLALHCPNYSFPYRHPISTC